MPSTLALKMPTREEAIAQIVGMILGPASAIAGCLTGPISQVASQIQKIGEKKPKKRLPRRPLPPPRKENTTRARSVSEGFCQSSLTLRAS